jgi:hypothetical protein
MMLRLRPGSNGIQRTEIALEFDQNMAWANPSTSQFNLAGVENQVAAGAVSGKLLTHKLKGASTAKGIAYLDSKS